MLNSTPALTAPLTPAVQHLVDAAVHRSVSNTTKKNGYMRCADYAIVGARVLALLTHVAYRPIAGGEVMDFGGRDLFVLCSPRERRRNAKHLSQLSRYHCWIEAEHAQADGASRTEVIDFTVRHNHLVAREAGRSFTRANQHFLWVWEDEDIVPPELLDHPAFSKQGPRWRWEERDCTNLLHAYEKERPHYFNRQVSQALNLLADQVENGEPLVQY